MSIYRKKRAMPTTGREKLRLDVRPMLAAKGILKGYTYLKKVVGLPSNYAQRLSKGKVYQMSNKYMEQLCLALNCTPNDLYIYTVPPAEGIGENHALAKLYRPLDSAKEILTMLSQLNSDELKEFYEKARK